MPSLAETKNVEDVIDKDAEKKGKAKEYADAKRNAVESDIAVGDQVLLRQKQDNKLTTENLKKWLSISVKINLISHRWKSINTCLKELSRTNY